MRNGRVGFLQSILQLSKMSQARLSMHQKSAYIPTVKAPLAVLVTCMDCRLLPAQIFMAKPGEMFVIRNPGNFIPHLSTSQSASAGGCPSGEMAGLQLGIQRLAIPDIIVCGHADCKAGDALKQLPPSGAVERPSTSDSPSPVHLMTGWLNSHGKKTLDKYHRHMEQPEERVSFESGGKKGGPISAIIDPENEFSKTDKLMQINVLQQLEHLQSYDFVRRRVETGQVALHATWYDLHTNKMYVFNHSRGQFVFLPTTDISSLTHFIYNLRNS